MGKFEEVHGGLLLILPCQCARPAFSGPEQGRHSGSSSIVMLS